MTTPVSVAKSHPAAALESPCTHCGETARVGRNLVGAYHPATGSEWCADGVTVAYPGGTATTWATEQAKDLVAGDRFFITDRHAFEATGDGLTATDTPPPPVGWLLVSSHTDPAGLTLVFARQAGPVNTYTMRVRPTRMVLVQGGEA